MPPPFPARWTFSPLLLSNGVMTKTSRRATPGAAAVALLCCMCTAWPGAARPPRRTSARGYQETPEILKQAARVTAISLERTPCFGSCPAYTVTLHRDGRATYTGKAHARRHGLYVARLQPWAFEQLARLLAGQGFFQLRPSYRAPVTCQASAILSVHLGKRVVRVQDYGRAGPAALWGLQLAVDATAERLDWRRPKTARRGKALEPCQLAAAVEQRLIAWRGRKPPGLPPLVADEGLRRWANRDAERACRGGGLRGTIYEEINSAASARMTSREVKDGASGLKRFTAKHSPLRLKQLHRLGVGAALDAVEGTYCVVVYVGR